MTSSRGTMAVVLVGLLLAPAALALPGEEPIATTGPGRGEDDGPTRTYGIEIDNPLQDSPSVPCLRFRLTAQRPAPAGGGWQSVEDAIPDGCESPEVDLEWNATSVRGRGFVTFTLDAEATKPDEDLYGLLGADVRVRTLSPLAALGGLFPRSPPRVALAQVQMHSRVPVAPPTVVIVASFDASWSAGCADARGAFAASVGGKPVEASAPADLFRDLCRLSMEAPSALASSAVDVASRVGTALQPAVASSRFARLVAGLAALAPPEPPTHAGIAQEGRAAGDASLLLLDDDTLAEERHEVRYDTPVAEGTLSGGASVPLPADAPQGEAPRAVAPERSLTPRPSIGAAEPSPAPTAPDAARPAQDAPRVEPLPAARPAHAVTMSAPSRAVLDVAPAPAIIVAAGAFLLLAGLALYQRARQPDALRHEGRAALFRACMERQRGATAGELAAATRMERKTAEYHLYYLVRIGMLRADRDAHGLRRFAAPSVAPTEPSRAGRLEDAILACIRARPGASTGQIAKELGIGRRRVDRHVKDFLLRGLVESRVEGRRRLLYPA